MGSKLFARHISIMSAVVLCLLSILLTSGCRGRKREAVMPPPPTIAPKQVDPWKEAARKVEEDRGEPVGKKAQVDVPAELKHYSDRRRFLAVQVAEWREQKFDLPHDYADLVELIRSGELVEMEPLGKDYILYGVGANATDEPLTHYDRATGENIPLFATTEEFEKEDRQLSDSLKQPQARVIELQGQLKKTGRRDRARRNSLQAQLSDAQKSVASISSQKKLLESFYKNPERRKAMMAEYRALADLAADFAGKTYDLNDPTSRRQFKVRLLSFIRPQARDVLMEIARAYDEKFDRPLPITSMMRPEQYQRHLSETNANATRISAPPHSTGLAFDVFDRYMTAGEQDYLMQVIARLKEEGRVEALRENRDHIHVFAFADGSRPDEGLIAESLGPASGGKTPRQAATGRGKEKKGPKGAKLARSEKKKSSKASSATAVRRKGGKGGKKVRAEARVGH
jgi:hypothetical protein